MGPRRPERAADPGRVASDAVIALATAALLAAALALHPVGDYHAESDFYGGYAAGARLIEHGHVDAARYPVVGPVYEFALAIVGFIPLDLFLLAKLLSVASAGLVLACMAVIARRRIGAAAAFWLTALMAVNPIFARYGYSASTDMLTLALQSGALLILIAPRESKAGGLALAGAGALAALATLTRYSAALLLPAGAIALALSPRAGLTRRAAIALFIGGFAIVAMPWTVYSIAHGHVPGEPLIRYFSFYASTSPDRSIQDLAPTLPDSMRAYHSLGDMLRRDAGGLALTTLRRIPEHLALDARDVLGWPAALIAVFGIALALAMRSARGFGALWLVGAFQALALAPVFHSPRYALPLVPIELSLAAAALSWPLPQRRGGAAGAGARPIPWRGIAALIGVATIILGARASWTSQREVRRLLPTEVIEAGRALHSAANDLSRVISRKGHIGYYSGVPVVPFPRFAELAELAAHARATHADFLYYSWYEAQLRPEFAWLLDTTAAVPGLERICVTTNKRSLLYRIRPGFGTPPAWLSDPWLKRLHESRALADVLPDSLTVPYRITLGVDALDHGDAALALRRADEAIHLREDQPLAWQVRGHALMLMGRPAEAAEAFERSLALDPNDAETRAALDSTRHAAHRVQ